MFDLDEMFRDPDEELEIDDVSKAPPNSSADAESTYEEIMHWIVKPRAAAFVCTDCGVDLGMWRGNFWSPIRGGTRRYRLCTGCRVKRVLDEHPEEFANRLSEKESQSKAA